MMDDVVIIWEVDDGYAGGQRPQKLTISRSEWDEIEPEDRDAFVDEMIEEEFAQRVTYRRVRIVE